MKKFWKTHHPPSWIIAEYLRQTNRLEPLLEKYDFIREKQAYRGGLPLFYESGNLMQIPGLELDLNQIPAPQLGVAYIAAPDYFLVGESYTKVAVQITTEEINPRYFLYNFYEKEIPKILKQLGYKCNKVALKTVKRRLSVGLKPKPKKYHVSAGWQIRVPSPRPLIVF